MKQIILQDTTHQAPFILPDVRGTVDQVGNSFVLLLPTFHNDLPTPWTIGNEDAANELVDAWIARMRRELGYTVKSEKEI